MDKDKDFEYSNLGSKSSTAAEKKKVAHDKEVEEGEGQKKAAVVEEGRGGASGGDEEKRNSTSSSVEEKELVSDRDRQVVKVHSTENNDGRIAQMRKEGVETAPSVDEKGKRNSTSSSVRRPRLNYDSLQGLFDDSIPENEFLIKYFFGISPNELQDADSARKAIYTLVVGLIPQEWRHIYRNSCKRLW